MRFLCTNMRDAGWSCDIIEADSVARAAEQYVSQYAADDTLSYRIRAEPIDSDGALTGTFQHRTVTRRWSAVREITK